MSKRKHLLTLEQLVKFCKDNKLNNFNSNESGYTLSVQIPSYLEFTEDNSDDLTNRGLLFTNLKVCHTLLNRNGSFISDDNMKKAMPSLKYRPILGFIHQLDDGTWDFHAHDMEFTESEDGEVAVEYKEQQIGVFTSDNPTLEYDKDQEKTYVVAPGVIPENYTRAADIIRKNGGTKVSCELCIEKMSYNAKEKYLELQDFYFLGCTCLGKEKNGKEISEGMEGSRLDIADFSTQNNSMFLNIESRINEINEKLCQLMTRFEDNNFMKGGNKNLEKQKIKELLEKYSKTEADITFEINGLSDDELENIFKENFDVSGDPVDPHNDIQNHDKVSFSVKDGSKATCLIDVNQNVSISFELSHSDIRAALNVLIGTYRNDNEWCYVNTVYDNYFIMSDWDSDSLYRHEYTRDGDNISLTGERIPVFNIIVTESEKLALEEMRQNYSSFSDVSTEFKKFKNAAEIAEQDKVKADKEKIFEDESYQEFINEKEFTDLINDIDKYSIDELKVKADLVFASLVKSKGSFSTSSSKEKSHRSVMVPQNYNNDSTSESDDEYKPYGDMFDE